MATTETKVEPKVTTVKMKFTGHFRGTHKVVSLPIPLISKSQQLDESEWLVFKRASDRTGPAFCDVPMEWVGALMNLGGHWHVADTLTPELTKKIEDAAAACKARMDTFALENELVS